MSGWRTGDPLGERRFVDIGEVGLESGARLPVTLAHETWGRPRRDPSGAVTNAVLVLHALTGDAHVVGAAGNGQPTPGWWSALVGPGRAVDTTEYFVVAANVLGGCQGSTGPSSTAPDGRPWGSRFPAITVRDQVAAEAVLADRLGVDRWHCVLGGSMGGMRALEWIVGHPERVGSALVLAVGAAASADQIATQTTQIQAIRSDPAWLGGDYHAGPGPVTGVEIARRIAHLTYRTADELDARFGRRVQNDGRYEVASYLDHQAAKLSRRFDAGSYVALTEAMNGHDVGRGRGGIAAALARVTAPVVVAGVDSDRLYPLAQQKELSDLIPTAGSVHVLSSPYGHDGFLLETEQLAPIVRGLLRRTAIAA